MNATRPTLTIEHKGTMADRRAYHVIADYGDICEPTRVTFSGPASGYGPVIAIFADGYQHFVDDPARFGSFGEQWIRNFYG